MREIKFRVWDTKSESMEYEIAIGKGYREDSYILFLGLGETFIIDDDIVKIMQYTGLKDKNGKDIYEKDILAFDAKEWGSEDDYNFLVEQSITGEWVGAGICTEWETYCKVIGNIYENLELLRED